MTPQKHTTIITGGAIRIGRAIALELADAGHDILLHYRSSAREAEETASLIRERGVECHLLPMDLGEPGSGARLIEDAVQQAPGLDGLILNASIFEPGDFNALTPEQLDRTYQVNLRSSIFALQAFAASVKDGSVVALLDTRVATVRTDHFAYSLFRHAMLDVVRSTARTLGPGIRVNGVAPGPILAPVNESDTVLDEVAAATPLQRAGDPADVASAVRYLMGANFVTGDCLFVDGGQHLMGEAE